jgi:hypothetical protein
MRGFVEPEPLPVFVAEEDRLPHPTRAWRARRGGEDRGRCGAGDESTVAAAAAAAAAAAEEEEEEEEASTEQGGGEASARVTG